jgi:hypothetical protein
MVSVQQQPCEGNGEQQEHRPAAEQPRAHAPTPPARGRTRSNDRHTNEGANVDANEGVNVDANIDVDAPPLFRQASQNLTAAAMLLRGCLEVSTS